MKNLSRIYLFLTVVSGLTILWPLLDFQFFLSQGDHGRDLYCFWRTLNGELPYRDFSWVFGPLMPYYYATFYKLFGVSIQSILLGQNLLVLLSGVTTYLICSAFFSPVLSLACAFWFWAFRGVAFFYTYNHSGGLLFLLLSILALARYVKEQRRCYVYWGSAALLCLLHIRLNIGVSTLIVFFTSLLIIDHVLAVPGRKKNRVLFLWLSLSLLGITAAVHWALVHPLPRYVLNQCFPFNKSDRTDVTGSFLQPFTFLWHNFKNSFAMDWPRRITGVIILIGTALLPRMFSKSTMPREEKKKLILMFGILIFVLAFSLHEFMASGVYYRINWALPFFIIYLFFLAGTFFKCAPPPFNTTATRRLIIFTLLISAFFQIRNEHEIIRFNKLADNRLQIEPHRVYTSQSPFWFMAVESTHKYLKENLGEDELFFAVPFDPIFYFLNEKKSPTRQLIFFEHKNIPSVQEKKIIAELEAQGVNTIVVSKTAHAPHEGLGTMGKEYCPLIADYILENFESTLFIGDWVAPGGWAWHYGVRIYKRKEDSGTIRPPSIK